VVWGTGKLLHRSTAGLRKAPRHPLRIAHKMSVGNMRSILHGSEAEKIPRHLQNPYPGRVFRPLRPVYAA
jgi:hypothetical protein